MKLEKLELSTDYRTGASDPIGDFYLPCLSQSSIYLRAAGFFRSTILSLMGPAYIEFAKRGGRAELVCSPKLEPEDIDAIMSGQRTHQELIEKRLLMDVDEIISSRDLELPAITLATLVALGSLRISIAYRPNCDGMYHEKMGCFIDEESNRVSFIGSANETFSAWADRGNFESVEVFCSWHSMRDNHRTEKHETYLRNLISNRVPGVTVIDFPEAAKRRLFEKACASFDDISVSTERPKQRVSSGKDPLPHQTLGLASWRAAGYRGILKHATGSGKTFTAILAIAEHARAGLPSLVLVPSQLLQMQWKREIEVALQDSVLLLAGGGHQRWREAFALQGHTAPNPSRTPRITIAVMATAATREFRAKLKQGGHLLVVADEVHQTGSPEYSEFFAVDSSKRLGLSATPERHGDPDGTAKILSYFGQILDPVVTLQDAIAAGRLVRYTYHPHGIRLTDEEAADWRFLTKRIGQLLGNNGGASNAPLSDEVKTLIIRRSRIAKKAKSKVPAATKIIQDNYEPGQSWLVYCEDVAHMDELAASLKECDIASTLYHSGMSADRNETLAWFEKNGGVLLAVRCLDEGIDIPSVTHALILASSQNPRQFIQRRGRILRRHPDKDLAVLHDLLVLPVDQDDDPVGSLESEFVRAVGFANDAMNVGAHAALLELAVKSGIDVKRHYTDIEDDIDG